MKSKGFTLVELIVAIVILAIVTLIAIPAYNKVNYATREKAYENKAKQIELAAEKWADEVNLRGERIVTVKWLIDEGYLQADEIKGDSEIVEDPRDGKSMICYMISIEVNDGVSSATLIEEENCDLVSDELNSRDVKVTAYEIDNDGVIIGILSGFENGFNWTNKNVLLIAEAVGGPTSNVFFESNGATIRPNGLNILDSTLVAGTLIDINNYSNAIIVKPNLFLDAIYTVGLFDGSGTKTTDVGVRIDKEPPNINFTYKTEWTKESKIKVEFTGSDGKGSGFKQFEICVSGVCDIVIEAKDGEKKEYLLANGTYEVYGVDKVGNRSKVKTLRIDKIDSEGADVISLDPEKTDWTRELTLIGTARDDRSGLVGYQFSEVSSSPSSWNNISLTNGNIRYTKNVTENKTYYFWVKDLLGNTSFSSYLVNNIDREIDSLGFTPYVENETLRLRINISDSKSGVKKYAVTTSNSKPTSGWVELETPLNSVEDSIEANSNGMRYLWVVDAVGNERSTSYNVDIKTKNVTLTSRSSSNITGNAGVSAKFIIETTVDNGSVSSSLSGTNISLATSGGVMKTGQEWSVCQESSISSTARSYSYCTGYTCSSGTYSGGSCVGPSGSSYSQQGDTVTGNYWCAGGTYHYGDTGGHAKCASNYSKSVGSCSASGKPTGSCTGSESGTYSYSCSMTCTWKGGTPSCSGYGTDYTCDGRRSSGYGSSMRCYSCSRGSVSASNVNICNYDCLVDYTYWQYTVTVKYIAN